MPAYPNLRRPASLGALAAPIALAAIALTAAVSTTAAAATGPEAGAAAKQKTAKVVLVRVAARGRRVAVSGRVVLPANTAKVRKRVRVAFALSGASGRTERFVARIDAKRRFKVSRATRLTGRLTLSARVRIGGRASGKQVRKRFKGPAAAKRKGPNGPVGPGKGGGPGVPVGTPLVGTFQLDEGVATLESGEFVHRGSYFRMLTPGGQDYLVNASSRSPVKTYTLLRPGTDGGLRTDVHQPRLDPPTDATGVRSNRIALPESFFGHTFTVVTEPVNFKSPFEALPVPGISHKDGKLTGQVAAWIANWNFTALFDQGTPKPDGSLPGFTTPLTGAYDPATRRYTLEWTSLITGGPFNGFGGYWHLQGTFEPAAG